ncbi:MAG: DUF2173 family protein [Sedimenticolaceae bacterium]|jgi:roadblock/LC7 domain-containing protein
MALAAELINQPGVIAAGEYSYRGDRFSYKGEMNDDMAKMAAIMCRATTMSEHMQVNMLESFCPNCGSTPPQGWIVRGPGFTVCNLGNVFAFVKNDTGTLNGLMKLMRERIGIVDSSLV